MEPRLIMRPTRGRTAVLVHRRVLRQIQLNGAFSIGQKKMRQEIFHNQLVTSRRYLKQSSLSLFMKKTSKCELMGYFRIGISKSSKNFRVTPTEQEFVLLRVSFEISDEQSLPFYTGTPLHPPPRPTLTASILFLLHLKLTHSISYLMQATF